MPEVQAARPRASDPGVYGDHCMEQRYKVWACVSDTCAYLIQIRRGEPVYGTRHERG